MVKKSTSRRNVVAIHEGTLECEDGIYFPSFRIK